MEAFPHSVHLGDLSSLETDGATVIGPGGEGFPTQAALTIGLLTGVNFQVLTQDRWNHVGQVEPHCTQKAPFQGVPFRRCLSNISHVPFPQGLSPTFPSPCQIRADGAEVFPHQLCCSAFLQCASSGAKRARLCCQRCPTFTAPGGS